MTGNIIAKITHGSRLFGTTTEKSDVDIKTVFVPGARDILLGRISTSNRDGTSNVMGKNTSDDTDQDNHDLIKFMRLVEAGSPEGFELLFAPDHAHLVPPSSTWRTLQARSNEFIHADLVPFERLIRKTSTIVQVGEVEEDAARKICTLLYKLMEGTGRKKSVSPHIDDIVAAVGDPKIVRRDVREGRDGTSHDVLAIAHKAVPVDESIGFAFKLANSIATEAAANQARKTLAPEQWKHLSLAVRLSSEMIELLQTGMLTFPRPEREFLYEVKVGNVSMENVKDRLDLLAARIADAKQATSLPLLPNKETFENFVVEAHFDVVAEEFKGFDRSP
ncbi:nucleotidyltransferase domain-containing protein [Rhizobium sp. MHM7A]|uniref:DNA polymerase beta superfamily protein n=1 Tax=Rhizobium sp. MHM7A TaxID=2583233 RepID=UPI001485EB6D|nr:nucleotidyltransferase domain-containing protein [Rhizobium sp. MHM7A]